MVSNLPTLPSPRPSIPSPSLPPNSGFLTSLYVDPSLLPLPSILSMVSKLSLRQPSLHYQFSFSPTFLSIYLPSPLPSPPPQPSILSIFLCFYFTATFSPLSLPLLPALPSCIHGFRPSYPFPSNPTTHPLHSIHGL